MTRLLVSVRSAAEAIAALAGGADVIDVKEPHRGALGPADPQVWRDVLSAVAGKVPVSVALGELADLSQSSEAWEQISDALIGVRWAKLGLARMAVRDDRRTVWLDALRSLPNSVEPVAVVYADWQLAAAPRPESVLEAAASNDVSMLLVDTFDKSAGNLLAHWSPAEVQSFAARVRCAGMKMALAGSLNIDDLPQFSDVPCDFIAVRGAACRGGREGTIDEQFTRRLSSAVQQLGRTNEGATFANA